eukprot:1812467-Pleurochrysis_carterae.AAC.1
MQVSGEMLLASWRRTFVRSRPRVSVRALYAQPRFECAIAFALVYPNEAYKCSAGGHCVAVDELPAAVFRVIGDFGAFGGGPS